MTAAQDTLQQRYEAIEQVYSECQWDDVARQSEALLVELPNDPGHPLRQRLQLLLGHTYLYGYQDAATASGFYSRVQAASAEPVLRDIAEQGLQQCASLANAPVPAAAETTPELTEELTEELEGVSEELTEPPTEPPNEPRLEELTEEPATEPTAVSVGQPFPFSADVINPAPASSEARPAMPWLEQLGDVYSTAAAEARTPAVLAVEVVDEPELIELAQADPTQAEELEVAVSQKQPGLAQEVAAEPTHSLSPEELAELSKGLLRVVIH